MSCDDLRLNLWNLRRTTCCFTLVDAKPTSMEVSRRISPRALEYVEGNDSVLGGVNSCNVTI